MTKRSLQVTYREGHAFAAYLHLANPTVQESAKMMPSPDGLSKIGKSTSRGLPRVR